MEFTIDPFSIAMNGISPNATPFQMVILGWEVEITETEVPVPLPVVIEEIKGGGVRPMRDRDRYQREQKRKYIEQHEEPKPQKVQKLKMITVKIEKDGEVYVKSKFFNDLSVTAKDVDIEIIERKKKPEILIKMIK